MSLNKAFIDLQRKGIDISKSKKVSSYTRFTINEDKDTLIEVFLVAFQKDLYGNLITVLKKIPVFVYKAFYCVCY